jgi:pyruvate-formate lyase-activating enzyme
MECLHTTETIDPESLERLSARVVTDGTSVYLERPGRALELLERDLALYRLLLPARRPRVPAVSHLVIEPTYACNLHCPLCFTHQQGDDLSLAEIERALAAHRGALISISGGEPTTRDDLPQIVRLVAAANVPLLATNGLRLADREYLRELLRAGLQHVTFSFNGFSEAAQEGTNGRATLRTKLSAIENLVAEKVTFLLSVLLLRGSSEAEVRPILELASRHSAQIREVRFRSAMPVGKHPEVEPFLPSEMLQAICAGAGISREDVLAELQLYRRLERLSGVMLKPCSYSFHLRRTREGFEALGASLRRRHYHHLLALYPPGRAVRRLLRRSRLWPHDPQLLKISVRVWPRASAVDLHDHVVHCSTRYIAGPKRGLPVCFANLLCDRGALERAAAPIRAAAAWPAGGAP